MNRYKQRVNQRLREDEAVRRLTDEELKAVHEIYLEMLDEFLPFCEKNDIFVTLGGGSVLGAVRHAGFIPWDDDVDLLISRQGLEKLKRVFPAGFHGKDLLRAPNDLPGCQVRIAQIENPQVLIEDYTGRTHGLAIDLFVLENVPDGALPRFLHGVRSLYYTAVSGLVIDYAFARADREKHPEEQQKRVSLEQRVRRVAGKCLSFRSAESWLNRLDQINQYPHDGTRDVGLPTGSRHYFGEINPRDCMMRAQHLPFEGRMFPVPAGYETYLSKLYGDYLRVPPEEEREYHFIRSITFRQSGPFDAVPIHPVPAEE